MSHKFTAAQERIAADARRPYADKITHLEHEISVLRKALYSLAEQIPMLNGDSDVRYALANYAKGVADNYRAD